MNRKDRRRNQAKARKGAGVTISNRPSARTSLSDFLLGQAGVQGPSQLIEAAQNIELASLTPVTSKVAHAFANWRSEREMREALVGLEALVMHEPLIARHHLRLGHQYRDLRRTPEALMAYRQCLKLDPECDEARHMIAALGGGDVPARADDRYVASLFDSFAENFDQTLVHWLDYRGPEIIKAATLAALGPETVTKYDILDLGCGTGLAAPLFKSMARRLDGVDLSGGMLAKAQARQLYDELFEDEIVRHLHQNQRRYDLVVAADVFVYFGALEEAFAAIYTILRSGGLFVLTLERIVEGEADFTLHKTGRYAHHERYLRRAAEECHFNLLNLTMPTVRMESKQPVPAWCLTLQKPH